MPEKENENHKPILINPDDYTLVPLYYPNKDWLFYICVDKYGKITNTLEERLVNI